MTRLDTVDVDALAESLRADAKNSAAGIEEAAKAAALLLIEQGEDVIKNILVAHECHEMSKGMFAGADLALVAETDKVKEQSNYSNNGDAVRVGAAELVLYSNCGRIDMRFGNIAPRVELTGGRYRFVLIGYRLPDADSEEE